MLAFSSTSKAQILDRLNIFKKSDIKVSVISSEDVNDLKADVASLATPKQPPRITGTIGELSAANFLSLRMANLGLVAVDKNYQRKFSFESAMKASLESQLLVGASRIAVPDQAVPLAFSSNISYTNYVISGTNEAGSIWLLPAKYSASEPGNFSETSLYQDARNAELRGAQGVIFYLSSDRQEIKFNSSSILPQLSIPVFLISSDAHNRFFNNLVNLTGITMNSIIKPELKSGINVYGMINNGAQKTVIISSSYDVAPSEKGDAPGADDNASGVSAMLLMAKRIREKNLTNYNYMFIAYGASHIHQNGSEAIFGDKNFNSRTIAYAIHFDKIGKLSLQNSPVVNGAGTYKSFKSFFPTPNDKAPEFELVNKGKDTSDYNTYFQHSIPYLSYTTGYNSVHGTDRDILGALNFSGIGTIVQNALAIVDSMELKDTNNIAFVAANDIVVVAAITPTKIAETGQVVAPKKELEVSLGIIPDLSYKDGGILIGKISAKKDADLAGLQAGDVIVQIRNLPIQTYSDYTAALSQFKKGQKTYIRFKRNGNFMQKAVNFT